MAQELAKALILKNQAKLSELSTRVKLIHREILVSAKDTVMRAVEAGKWLINMKELLPHGHFEKYVDEHMDLGTRTARRYMELHEKWPLIEKELGPDAYVSTIDGCLKIVKPSQPKRPALADFPPSELVNEQDGEKVSDEDSALGLDPGVAEAARAIRAKREALEKDQSDDQRAGGGAGVRTGKATIKSIEADLEKLFGQITEKLEDYHALKPDPLHFDCQQSLDSSYGDFRKWKRK